MPVIIILSYAGTQVKDSREPNVASKESDELGKSLRNVCHMSIKFFSSLGIKDLVHVNNALKKVHDWKELGLQLRIHFPTMKRIESEKRGNIGECMMEMLAAWLNQEDDVLEVGIPSWSILRTALKEMGENAVASHIPRNQHTRSTEQ